MGDMEWERIEDGYLYRKKELDFNRRFLGEYKANNLITILIEDEELNIEDILKLDFELIKEGIEICENVRSINIESNRISKYKAVISFKINLKIECLKSEGVKILRFSEKNRDYINIESKDVEVDIEYLSVAVWKDKFDKMLLNLSYVILVD